MKLLKKIEDQITKDETWRKPGEHSSGPLSCFDSEDNRERKKRAKSLAIKKNTTAQNIAGAWPINLNFPSFALIGPRKIEEIDSSLNNLKINLNNEEIAWLNLMEKIKMNKADISFQLYTARKFEPYKNIFEYIASTGIKNVELFALSDFDEKELHDLLQQNNLTALSAHISFESFENLKDTINKIKYLNIRHAIIPAPKAIPGKDFQEFFNLNESEWIQFAKEISEYIKIFHDQRLNTWLS